MKRRSAPNQASTQPLSVKQAILRGHLAITLPTVLIFILFSAIGFLIAMASPSTCGLARYAGLGIGIWLGWRFWAVRVPAWRQWAIRQGAPPDELEQWAIRTGLVLPNRALERPRWGQGTTSPTDLEYFFDLFFPVKRTRAVLEEIGRMGDPPSEQCTELVLPGGARVTLPFSSWLGARDTVVLKPGERIRIDAYLTFPWDEALQGYFGEDPPGTGRSQPLYIRLWLFVGHRHCKLSFFAPTDDTSCLFVASDSIRQQLTRLLDEYGGILGMLVTDGDQGYLLPDLATCVDLPDLLSYYSKAAQVFDVDRWLEDVLQLEVEPGSPPEAVPPRQTGDSGTGSMISALHVMMGPWREPVPARYHRAFEARPFENCDYCHKPLLIPGTVYMITQYYEQGDLAHEAAMCQDCRERLKASYSARSRRRTKLAYRVRSMDDRLKVAGDGSTDRLEKMTCECLLCGADRDSASAYYEYAACQSNELVYQVMPMMICDRCTRRAYGAMSERTKEVRRQFYSQHLGPATPAGPASAPEGDVPPAWMAY